MARIPSPVVGRTQPDKTPLALRRTSASAEAFGAGVGRALGGLGKEISAFSLQLREQGKSVAQLRTNLDIARFTTDQDLVLDDMNKGSEEFIAFGDRYSEQFTEKAQAMLDSIDDPETKQNAFSQFTSLYARNLLRAQEVERKRNVATIERTLTEQVDTARNILLSDPIQLDKQAELLADSVQQAMPTIGLEAAKRVARDTLQKVVVSAIQGEAKRNPGRVLEALNSGVLLAPGVTRLVQRESGGRPTAQNTKTKHVGLYQFGGPRLSDLGLYQRGKGESFKNGKWTGDKWSGKFTIPGHPNVKTVKDFMANPEAQHTAFLLHDQLMEKEIITNNFDRFLGKHVQGVFITRQGIKNMLHLGGVGGTRGFFKGTSNVKDIEGTSVKDYALLGSEGPVNTIGDLNKILKPEQKTQLIAYAEAVRDDAIRRRKEATESTTAARRRAQDETFSELLVGVSEGTTSEADLLTNLGSFAIRPEQFTKGKVALEALETDLSEEQAVKAAVEIDEGTLNTVDGLLQKYGPNLQSSQRQELINRMQKIQRSGGILARADVQADLDFLKSNLQQKSGFFARFDFGREERYSRARRIAVDKILAGEDSRKVVDELITRFRGTPATVSSTTPPTGFTGGMIGTPAQLKERAAKSFGDIKTKRSAGDLTEQQFDIILEEYKVFARQLTEQQDQAASRRAKGAQEGASQ